MMLSRILYTLFPEKTFIRFRRLYRAALKKIHAPLSEEEFRKILTNEMQLSKGSVVFIHGSADSLNLRFDTSRLLEILLETVGEEGTLVFPCWHFTYRAEDYLRSGAVFDAKRSPSALGMLSEMARRYPGACRSLHPTNSIVAIGKQAVRITADHHTDLYPCGEKSPYYRCMEQGGKIIGIGVNAHFMSFVHCPEDVLKEKFPVKTRLDHVFEAPVKKPDGTLISVKTLAAHPQIRNNNINAFLKQYVRADISRNFTLRGNRFFIAHSGPLFDAIVENAGRSHTIYTPEASIRNN
jgi:aminoglycoside N3'-acetyltransferase